MSTTKAQLAYVNLAESYAGTKVGSKKHKELVDAFNKVRPDGWAMTYTAPWCATAASAWAIMTFGAKLAKLYFPLSANCGTIINDAMKKGIWVESDRWVPVIGSWILYDWNDSGVGENKGIPDHVGVVTAISGRRITVIEGNKGTPGAVGYRQITVDGRYIRGYVAINWSGLDKDWRGISQGAKKEPKYKTGTYQVVASNGLNVRKGAGTDHRILRAIAKGSKFKVTKTSGVWGYAPSLGGWLCLDYAKRI